MDIKKAAQLMLAILSDRELDTVRYPDAQTQHLTWMLDRIVDGMPTDKSVRWLCFVQGVVYTRGGTCIAELRTINKALDTVGIDEMKPESYKRYKARIQYHRTDDLRPETLARLPEGTLVDVLALWVADDGEKFAGDMIFSTDADPYWIPERDLILIEEITRQGNHK